MENIKLDQFQLTIFSHDYYTIYLENWECYPFRAQEVLMKDLGYRYFQDIKGRPLKIAPVIRLFGTNNYGQKCCVHVHGYFPYFYIKVEEIKKSLTPEFLADFAHQLEKAYVLAYGNPILKKTNKHADQLQSEFAKNSNMKIYIIYSIEIIEKYDVYGYHSAPETFLKVRVYDPKYVKALSKILSFPIILNRKFQTYEVIQRFFFCPVLDKYLIVYRAI